MGRVCRWRHCWDQPRLGSPSFLYYPCSSYTMLQSATTARELEGVQTDLLIQAFADRVVVLVTQLGKVGSLVRLPCPPTSLCMLLKYSHRFKPPCLLQCRSFLHLRQTHQTRTLSPSLHHLLLCSSPHCSGAHHLSAFKPCTPCTLHK